MQNYLFNNKTILIRVVMAISGIKVSDIAKETNTSVSLVSRHISGERTNIHIDLYFIEKIFNITVKDYMING